MTKAAVTPGGACADKNRRACDVARSACVATAAGSSDAAHSNKRLVGIIVGAPPGGPLLDDFVDVARTRFCMTAKKTIKKIMQ